MRELLTICKSQYSLEEFRANMMALNGYLGVGSFFNQQGCPYTMQEICEGAQRELQNARLGDENRYKSNLRKHLESLLTMSVVNRLMRAIQIWSVSEWVTLVKDGYDDYIPSSVFEVKGFKRYVTGELAFTAIAVLFLASTDHINKRDMKFLQDKIGQNTRKWEMEKDIIRDFPKGIHAQIQQGCSDLDSTSIRDIRVWVMTHHPDAFAQVLIHPSGRLFTEREICIAIRIFVRGRDR